VERDHLKNPGVDGNINRTIEGMYVQRDTEGHSRNHCCPGKALIIIYSLLRKSESVAFFIQHAKRMRCIILTSMTCLVLHIFPHYLINGTIFVKKLLNIKCGF
jgi:hypothetical protein